VDEVIAFTNKSIYPAQLQGFLSYLVTSMYYLGEQMGIGLPGSWLRDERARLHTDLVVFRPGQSAEALIWTPQNKPLGCPLPGEEEYCACPLLDSRDRWRRENSPRHINGASKHIYRCTSCTSKLICKVSWPTKFELFEDVHGTSYLRCAWPFEPPTMEIEFNDHRSMADISGSDSDMDISD
jgi:hypothetical protein